MECPSLCRRVSTRAGVFSAAHRHHSTSNASCLPSSSRPTTPIVISPEVLGNGSKPISDPRLSSLMTSAALQSSPSSSLCPALSSTQIANSGEGQFSDAGSDQEEAADREAHKRKRVKLNSFHSTRESLLPLPTKSSSAQGPASRKEPETFHHLADANEDQDTPEVEVVGGGVGLPLNTESAASTNKGLRSTRPAKSSPATVANQTSNTYDCKGQLPMATRRLAMLVGIPESSQAIIQSTLSLPSSRSKLSNSQSYASTPRAGTNPQGTACLSTSDSLNCPVPSSSASNDCTPRYPKPPSSAGAACSSPRDFSNYGATVNARPVAARRCASTSRAVSGLTANTTDGGSQQASRISSHGSSCDTRVANQDSRSDSVAPRYGRASSSCDDYTMPAPGSFSIRAPPAAQLLQRYDPSLCSEASEVTSRGAGHQLESFEESSEFDGSSQPPSTCPAQSPSACSSQTIMVSVLPSMAHGNPNKRKARTSRSQTAGSDNGLSEIELVKPPPTINGKVSHGRKVPVGYIKRTPNSFLMFRSHVIANKLLPPGVENDNRQISRVVSGLWAGLSEEDLRSWQTASRELRAAARARNPGLKHAPNQKRKEVVRRRRSGQLPGETPEQRVEREKASAAAVAKGIINSRGEKLGKGKMVPLPGSSARPSTSNAVIHPRDDPVRDTSRPEFRAPVHYFCQPGNGQAATPRSEYAESTLTTSPVAEARRSLSCVPESVADESSARQAPMTASELSTGRVTNGHQDVEMLSQPQQSHMVHQTTHQGAQQTPRIHPVNLDPRMGYTASEPSQGTVQQDPRLSVSSSGPPVANQNGLSLNQPDTQAYSGLFSHVGTGLDVAGSLPAPFSDEIWRSLGLTTSDLTPTQPTTSSLPPPTTATMHDSNFHGKSFAMRDDSQTQLQSSPFWPQGTGFNNLVNSNPAEYPFREPAVSEHSSQISGSGASQQTTYPLRSQGSQSDCSKPLEFSALIDDSSFSDPLKSDGLDFDSMYLSYQSHSASNQALEDACQSLTTNTLAQNTLDNNNTSAGPTLNQDHQKEFWVNS
ncbi:hypothetical protein PGT21_008462 [Puccinia graminis f. sp. tritici]|uniref:HMG box domain-containing protein n=1 Tax=Puccinia graminis f. sp. tritici TaxID=56615 RepID=A0A5B0NQ87_PUCGR|nr:hypothetical protein PGT21_008462 [Puccinia graminis f. sp. tritici]KAA1090078.1 hypothetical protein PGTUg99_035225 [Puccinia graminis f. sp. tritici]